MSFVDVFDVSAVWLPAARTLASVIGRRLGPDNAYAAQVAARIVVASTAAMVSDGDATRSWLLAAQVAVWMLRLSWQLYRRATDNGEDPRHGDRL
jgi:steroid 5-alpha reductase family enzyme